MSTGSDPVATYFRHVVPWGGHEYVNIHAFEFDPATKSLKPKASRAARDYAEAVSFTRWVISMGWEVFVCLSSQRTPGVGKPDKRGGVNYRALRGLANAVGVKAFWVDVDVKPGAYGSPQEALQAFQEFCATVGLPAPTMLVYSGGGGFHAYWILKNTIPVDEWRPLAGQLAEACRQHGLNADHNVTVNAVQILRVPGSSNRKYGAPRPVTHELVGPAVDLERIKVALIPYQAATPANPGIAPSGPGHNEYLSLKDFPAIGPPRTPGHWLDGISPDPYTLEEVAVGCPFIQETLDTGGKGQREPLWFAAGHVAVFTAGGVEDYKKLSEGHENYSPADTEAKFSRILDDKRATDKGWPRCETIENAGATQCATCHNKSSKKSPLNFAQKKLDPPTSEVTPPGNPQAAVQSVNKIVLSVPGFPHHPTSGIVHALVAIKKNGKDTGDTHEVPLLNCPIWDPKYREDQKGQFGVHFDTILAQQQVKHVIVPNSEMRNTDTLRGCLLRHGLSVHPGQEKGVLSYMAAFKDMMRDTRNTIERQELMGWCDEGGLNPVAFIYGPTKFNCKGNVPFNQPDPMIRAEYFPKGSAIPWFEAMKMLNAEKRPEMDLLAATAFAAHLMRFTGEKGVVISAFSSTTAVHKSSAVKVGQAVWGSFKGINQLSDTLNSVIARVGLTRIVPTYYDEMKSSQVKHFASMIYTFAGGRGKGRLGRNAEIKDVDTWDSLLIGVSNESLFDHIAQLDKTTDAGIARVFEFEVAPPGRPPSDIDMEKAGITFTKLENNYGHAGMIYAEHLGKSVDTLQQRVTDKRNWLLSRLNITQDERFWWAAATVLLVGAEIANEIKLAQFDIPAMEKFIDLTFAKMRAAKIAGDLDISKSNGIVAALAAYVNTHRRSVLATDVVGQSARAGLSQVQVLNLADLSSTTNEYTIRYIRDPSPIMRLSQSALKGWLKEKQLSPGVYVKNKLDLYGAREIVTSITSGTARACMKQRQLEHDLTHPDLVDLY